MSIKIPADFPVQPLKPGQEAKDKVTCGTCGLSWDDAIGTAWTPAPSGRCPFEYFHAASEEQQAGADLAEHLMDSGLREVIKTHSQPEPGESEIARSGNKLECEYCRGDHSKAECPDLADIRAQQARTTLGKVPVWSLIKPVIPGNYWMRRVGKDDASIVYIEADGDVWPCSCQSTSPYDMSKHEPVEWAPVIEPGLKPSELRAIRLALPYGDPTAFVGDALKGYVGDPLTPQAQSRYLQAKAELRQMQMIKGGIVAQADAIGRHYTRVAKLAQFLHVMVEVYKNSQSDGLEQLMREHLDDIKDAHLEDFGLVLDWTPQNPGNLPPGGT